MADDYDAPIAPLVHVLGGEWELELLEHCNPEVYAYGAFLFRELFLPTLEHLTPLPS